MVTHTTICVSFSGIRVRIIVSFQLLEAQRLGFLKFFGLSNEFAEDAHFALSILLEVEAELLAESKLEQVVIKRFFADAYCQSRILKGVANNVTITFDTVVHSSPKGYFVDDVCNASLLSTLGYWHSKNSACCFLSLDQILTFHLKIAIKR